MQLSDYSFIRPYNNIPSITATVIHFFFIQFILVSKRLRGGYRFDRLPIERHQKQLWKSMKIEKKIEEGIRFQQFRLLR